MKLVAITNFDVLFKTDINWELFLKVVEVMTQIVKKEVSGMEITIDDVKFSCTFLHGIIYFTV